MSNGPTLPGFSGGNPLERLRLLMSLIGQQPAAPNPATGPSPEQLRSFVRSLLELSTAQSEQGERARTAWRQVGEGLMTLLRLLVADERK